MKNSPSSDWDGLLSRVKETDGRSGAELLPQVYDDLKAMARRYFARERADHTLQATALVHEAYLQMKGAREDDSWRNRGEFLRVASVAMRHILVNHARHRNRLKRGGKSQVRLELGEADAIALPRDVDLLALDEALEALAAFDARKARIVELRYFAGCTIEETAKALDLSTAQVKRDWSFTKAWLSRELRTQNDEP